MCAGEEESQASSNAVGREVRLSRVVEQLKGRLQTLREENQQLEEMLHQSDARASSALNTVWHRRVDTLTALHSTTRLHVMVQAACKVK